MPWPDRPHGNCFPGGAVEYGVVPRLPSSPRVAPATAERDHEHGLETTRRRGPGRVWEQTEGRVQHPRHSIHAELLHVPQMKENQPAAVTGAQYWRSLQHLADGPEMRETIGKEFPGYDVDEMLSPSSRRSFLKLAGASMALAGLTLSGCRRWPEEKLAPYSTNPRGRMPGVPEQYATAMEVSGVA